MGLGMIRSFYHSKFESLARYGIILWWADSESIPIFKLQKRVIGSVCVVLGQVHVVDSYLRIARY